MIEPGTNIVDVITKAEGVVMTRIHNLDESIAYEIQFLVLDSGKPTNWLRLPACRVQPTKGSAIGFADPPGQEQNGTKETPDDTE